MSRGRIYRPTYEYQGEKRQSSVWWADYSVGGERKRESTGKRDKEAAQRFLTRRLREFDAYGPETVEYRDVRFPQLMERIRKDYKKNGYNEDILERRLAHLEDFFGDSFRVIQLGDAQVLAYVDHRIEEGAANATINRELSALRRALTLGRKAKLVAPDRMPDVGDHMLKENNVRKGFWSPEEFSKLKGALPARLLPLVDFAYTTGWRRSELLSRNWEHVRDGVLRLEPGESKSDKAREFPLNDFLRDVVERQRERKAETERKHGCDVEALFFYYEPSRNGLPAGRRIKSYRRAWATATKAAGCPDRLFHSFRRTAARRLLKSGCSEKQVMRLAGWASRSVMERYHIVTDADLRDAVDRLPPPPGAESTARNAAR